MVSLHLRYHQADIAMNAFVAACTPAANYIDSPDQAHIGKVLSSEISL